MAETIEGLDEVIKKLERLNSEDVRSVLKTGVRKGGAEIRKQAVSNAKALDRPETSNAIYKNIAQKMWGNRKGKRYIGTSIGVLGGARNYSAYGEIKTGKSGAENPGGDTFYWRFLEFGSGKIRARPFLEPSLRQAASAALEKVVQGSEKMINKLGG